VFALSYGEIYTLGMADAQEVVSGTTVESIQLPMCSVISCVICYHCCGRLIYDCQCVMSVNLMNGQGMKELEVRQHSQKQPGHVRLKGVVGYKWF